MTSPRLAEIFKTLELDPALVTGGDLSVISPIDGTDIGTVQRDSAAGTDAKIAAAVKAFEHWRQVPAPRRGELVRRYGDLLRRYKEPLGALVTLECGKILEEGKGEVQEMIDICDFAVGLSRQLYGLTIQSERPGHHMRETWQPLGPVGVISAFNFPVAVWAWNTAIALVCGDPVIWKPSEKTPITALVCDALLQRAIADFGADAPAGLSCVLVGERDTGEQLTGDSRVPLISATGSCRMGRQVGPKVAERFGRCLLELGGNNAIIVTDSADLDLAVPAIVFGAVGTAGQRCTSTRRIIVHESLKETLVARLKKAYAQIRIGDPLDGDTLVGPLIDGAAFEGMARAIEAARGEGGHVTGGERVRTDTHPGAYYVTPAIAEMPEQTPSMLEETFAPLLYVIGYTDLDEAIALHNGVPQGLSSAIFTTDMREAERFVSATGSDCGIANVNIGTSGAEIGGAFGGEKETGGGRESGSDSWRAYMRRQTSTVNYSHDLPLAQGIKFDLG
ncbi:L-piperidine-6-carboxylate dehydrogenase [Eilatimonas milleporae]|uniref:aldehyde dehydrogenase (NAD(+)) n=1 Tax=Eilatimonas milleporae TaxID=911205 RepID=A0A3M0CDA2_9PROT|nr:aldehyde dehydrogenase family protein [Eilatimonas milleporae]RMB07811.1 delta-1-piperideine-6-carboxylate dehydrogenase [Eilatimonas milleporae]